MKKPGAARHRGLVNREIGRVRAIRSCLIFVRTGHPLQAPLPEKVEATILSVAPGVWRLGNGELEVRRIRLSVFGYEVQFIIR